MTQNETVWLIEPRDPLIVRDGRPFDNTPGVRARSLPFPPPSVIAGGIRTRAGIDQNGRFIAQSNDVNNITIRGPLLLETKANTFFVPAPADALVFEPESDQQTTVAHCLKKLVPLQTPYGMLSDLGANYAVVGLQQPDPRKPANQAPHFWQWQYFEQWLIQGKIASDTILAQLGIQPLPQDLRTHVSIEAANQTANEGMLFQTRGLEFRHTPFDNQYQIHDFDQSSDYALAVTVQYDAAPNLPLRPITQELASLGGERRLAYWQQKSVTFPKMPSQLIDMIIKDKACRIVLLTPACWQEGFKPQVATLQQNTQLDIAIKAIAVQRPQVISGWDFAKNKAKKTRRLAPAGTVLFVTFNDHPDIEQWLQNVWMQCISDDVQDRRDGFGLAVLGTWDGTLETIKGDDHAQS